MNDGTLGFKMGASPANSRYFDGGLDELRLYDRALTVTEINELATINPGVSTLLPADDATGVGVDDNLVITFDKDMQAVTAKNVYIKKLSNDSVVETIAADDAKITISGATVTINPDTILDEKTDYYVNIDSGAFEDLSSNGYSGMSGNESWNFTTEDTTAPTVSTLSPVDEAAGVSSSFNLEIVFDEAVDAESGDDNDIVIKKSSDNSTVEIIDAQDAVVTGSGSTTITINPTTDLSDSTSYYVQIGADAFDDSAGNSYAGISDSTTWNFTTADTTNPQVSIFSPADETSNVAIDSNLVITFNEEVDAESGVISLYKASDSSLLETVDITSGSVTGSGTSVITINLANNLANGTSYFVHIAATAFDDTAGNSYAGIANSVTWNFTTTAQQSGSDGATSSGSGGLPELADPVDNYKEDTGSSGLSNIVVVEGGTFILKVKAVDADQVKKVTVNIAGKTYKFSLNNTDRQNPVFIGHITLAESGIYKYRVDVDYGWTVRRRQGQVVVNSKEVVEIPEKEATYAETKASYYSFFSSTVIAPLSPPIDTGGEEKLNTEEIEDLPAESSPVVTPSSQPIRQQDDQLPEEKTNTLQKESRSFLILVSQGIRSLGGGAKQVGGAMLSFGSSLFETVRHTVAQISIPSFLVGQPKHMYDKVTIKLASAQGEPLANAQVTLFSDPKEGMTNENGIVEFSGIEAGKHKLEIHHEGYTSKQNVVLDQEVEEITIHITAEFKPE